MSARFPTLGLGAAVDNTLLVGIELPPVAPMLMQSLRAVGYTPAAALADLIDNSIAAGARNVAVRFAGGPAPFVAIIDNGQGMDEATLVAAMRFGSRDPRDARSAMDLGRFGLGLKTASLSQCRRVTVASLHRGTFAAAAWDLDDCEHRNAWWLARPDPRSIPCELRDLLTANGHGTAVIWQQLDHLVAGANDPERVLDGAMDVASDHLALVFHRFLASAVVGPFDITVNGRSLPRLDPFLEGHVRGQALHPETFTIDGHDVVVSPFVLPFPSRLKPGELDRSGGRDSLKTGHGFYVYRGGRLVVPGGWFRIVPADQLVRLARVRVDVPVELDHLWKVDIRKTVAEPPAALRPHLKRIVGDVTLRSRRVYTHKGAPAREADRIALWERHDLRDGAAAWRINREHPAVAALSGVERNALDVERLLRLLEEGIPLHDIHLHISNDLPVAEGSTMDDGELQELARRLVATFGDAMLERLPMIDPFSRDPGKARLIAERLRT